MYIPKEERIPEYDIIIATICNGIKQAVVKRNRTHMSYVFLRAAVIAWRDLGGGYNNISDIRSIFQDVYTELSDRMCNSLRKQKDKHGDVDNPLQLPKPPEPEESPIKKVEPIVDQQGKPLKSEDKK